MVVMKRRTYESAFRDLAVVLLAIGMLGCAGSSASKANGGAGGATGGAGGATFTVTSCAYQGMTYPVGADLPNGDCNSCVCTATGPRCTFRACLPDGGGDLPLESCALTAEYRYGPIGGNGLYQDQATLTPPATYVYTRMGSQRADAGDVSCAPALPDCGSAKVIDVSDLLSDLLHADVQSALAEAAPPSYGRDDRPLDGTMFQFLRADGHGFLVGSACPATGTPACVSPPDGIALLVADLRALDVQQLTDPSCAALQH